MTPAEIDQLAKAIDKRRPVTAPLPVKAPRSIAKGIGIAGGLISFLVIFWQLGDGLFATDAEATIETATRISAEARIEKDHGDDMRDVATINSAQDTAIELLKQRLATETISADEARSRIEGRLDRHERRGH